MTSQAPVGTFTHNLVRNASYPFFGGGDCCCCCSCCKVGRGEAGRGCWCEEERHRPCADSSGNTQDTSFFLKAFDLFKKNTSIVSLSSLVGVHMETTPLLMLLPVVGTPPHYPGPLPKGRRQPHCSRFCLPWKLGWEGVRKRRGGGKKGERTWKKTRPIETFQMGNGRGWW